LRPTQKTVQAHAAALRARQKASPSKPDASGRKAQSLAINAFMLAVQGK
jgi:hypothetical protein